jgi:sugar lactone lactonase YvrE
MPALTVVVLFLCLPAVLSAQIPSGTRSEQATQKQKAAPPPERAESTAFNMGKFPIGITFDGANIIWVTNEESNNVMRLRVRDGAVLETFKVGTLPLQVFFDGKNIWVTNGRSESVSRLKR